jgi:hypothetical protein
MTEWSDGDMSEEPLSDDHRIKGIPGSLAQFRARTVVNTLTIYPLEEDEITTITSACTGVGDVVRSLRIKR